MTQGNKITRGYDVMQVCESGHIITSRAINSPENLKLRCPICGKPTITECLKCHTPIQGYFHRPNVFGPGPDKPPAHCHQCGKSYPWAEEPMPLPTTVSSSTNIFVVHGHDDEMKQYVARTLEKLHLTPIILHEQANQGKTIIEKFEANAEVGFAIALLSEDDIAFSVKSNLENAKHRARQNVILELGYFVGKLGRSRVLALCRGENLELPSDFAGVVYTKYDSAGHWKYDLVKELKAAGYDADANKLITPT